MTNTPDTGLLPPQDEAAEQSTVGAMMLSTHALTDVTQTLTADDFYFGKNRHVFTACCTVDTAGDPVDAITVARELERTGTLDTIGGAAYLHTLLATVPTAANAAYYAEIVAEKAQMRRLIEQANRISAMAYASQDTARVSEIVENARQSLDDVAAARRGGTTIHTIQDLMATALDDWDSPLTGRLSTGWADLDRLIGGWAPGSLNIVAARPAIGKSVVAVNTLANAAKHGAGALMFSLEMAAEEVRNRLAASVASVELSNFVNHTLSPHDRQRVQDTLPTFNDWPLDIVDDARMGVPAMRTHARDYSRTHNLGLIVVDYLQLMHAADPKIPRHEQVASFSRGLKVLAKEFDVPVIALSQVNRSSEQRQDKRPTMAELRESGAIEADADTVTILHRDVTSEQGNTELELIVDKNRHGPRGSVTLAWRPHYSRADSMSRRLEAV